MKKILISLVVISSILTACNSYSQTGWLWVNPYPSNKNLKYAKFLNANTGFTLFDYKIHKTTDSGLHWKILGDTLQSYYLEVQFFNEHTGYVLGDSLYKTTDMGLNWTPICKTFFSEFSFINMTTGFVTSTNYTPYGIFSHISYTTNGGFNWSAPYYVEPEYFFDITVLSNTLGLIAAKDSGNVYLYKSFGPQSNWFRLPTNQSTYGIPYLFVKDSLTYFMSANNLKCTTDGGYNWFVVNLNNISDLSFINSSTGLAIGKNGKIHRTTDGGFLWSQIQSPNNYDLNSVSFGDIQTGYITGILGAVLKTTNAGLNWMTNARNFTRNVLNDVKFINRDTIFIVGDHGKIYRTTNQGDNWTSFTANSGQMLYKMFFLNPDTGYAVGRYGTVLKTTNCGNEWINLNTPLNEFFLLDVFFVNAKTGFISASEGGFTSTGKIYRTTNSGENWYILNMPYDMRYFFIRFFNGNTGFTSTWEDRILRTTDYGDSWSQMNTPQTPYVKLDICFINNLTGFTVGSYGYVYKTIDGGNNWQELTRLNQSGLYSIKFINQLTGFVTSGGGIFGGYGEIFYTSNGGLNWTGQYIPFGMWNEILHSVDFYNDSIGFVVGDSGIVLKTTTGGLVFTKPNQTSVPVEYFLGQNYPNPFNSTTTIEFKIIKLSDVKLVIYDILGREVKTLFNRKLKQGTYEVSWNGTNYPSGVYFYSLTTGDFIKTKKMLLIK